MSTATAPQPGTETEKPAVTYPLDSNILAILNGTKTVDLTGVTALLAEQCPVGAEEETLFILPENLQHLYAFIQEEGDMLAAMSNELRSALAAHEVRRAQPDFDHASESGPFRDSLNEPVRKAKAKKDAINQYASTFWSIVNELAGYQDVEIRAGFTAVMPKKESFIQALLEAFAGGGFAGATVIDLGSFEIGSVVNGDSPFAGAFSEMFRDIRAQRGGEDADNGGEEQPG